MMRSFLLVIVIALIFITSTTAEYSYPSYYEDTQTEDTPTEYSEDTPTEYTEDTPTEYEETPEEYTPIEYTPKKYTRHSSRKYKRHGPKKHNYRQAEPTEDYVPEEPTDYAPVKRTRYVPAKPTSYVPKKPVKYAPSKPTSYEPEPTSYEPEHEPEHELEKPVTYAPTKPTTSYAPVKPVKTPASTYTPTKPVTGYAPVSKDGLEAEFLAPQNAARAAVGLSPLVWDSTLATYAQWWANERKHDCALEHSHGRYGENIFWGGGSGFTPTQAVSDWVAERSNYHYGDNSCSGEMCGHYTQIVWETTTKVGCAKAECYYGLGVFMVCSYDPAGNYVGQKPY